MTYNVPQTTARRYTTGTAPKRSSIALNRRLILAQEEGLRRYTTENRDRMVDS